MDRDQLLSRIRVLERAAPHAVRARRQRESVELALEGFGELEDVHAGAVVGDVEDRRLGVGVDRDDGVHVLHPG